ncbi:hypothetical protein EZBTHKR_3220 [Elizabethkingia anophelis]|nr:hypothetical protein EZBTHKR_3220 [Elizabethkingia anophelis]
MLKTVSKVEDTLSRKRKDFILKSYYKVLLNIMFNFTFKNVIFIL